MMTAPPRPDPTLAQALAQLRRGGTVTLGPAGGALLLAAAETLGPTAWRRLKAAGSPRLVRPEPQPDASATGLRAGLRVCYLPAAAGLRDITALTDPFAAPMPQSWQSLDDPAAADLAGAAVQLLKLAHLLPTAVLAAAAGPGIDPTLISGRRLAQAASLVRVARARVPLIDAEETELVAFRPRDGDQEHIAIVIGQPDPAQPVLARLHSACLTGDLMGSLRCDCGDQLRGAIAEIARAGAGVLLYLAQEGRDIGIVNKLRAYRLQDGGLDTVDANIRLGFEPDERDYAVAAAMLRDLGITRVRLMTNNPDKLDQLGRHGVTVTDRVPHIFPSNGHNLRYLQTKAEKSGHMLDG